MGNLFRMDFYRMRKARSFLVCLILAFLLSLCSTPLAKLLTVLMKLLSDEVPALPESVKLSELLASPLSSLNAMLALISVCGFFYADVEHGYIKNIAGQMPKRGYTILSKFLVSIPHSLIFMLVSLVGDLLGTVFIQKIQVDAGVPDALRILFLKLLLLESLCAILLLFTAVLRNKSLGTVFAVLFGLDLMSLVYLAIDAGLDQLLPKKSFSIAKYMPDQLFHADKPDTVAALIVSAVVICLFLWLSVRIFDKKDVK